VRSFIPTPSHNAVAFGIFTIHFYALCILLGTIVAILIGRKRYQDAGGDRNEIIDIAIFAIPAGIVGGRLYHVATSPELYFGSYGHPFDAIKIWDGGMGIWGAVALGTLASFLAFKSKVRTLTFGHFADAMAPGLLIAQGIGRFGNWFNGELFGSPTTLPWGLKIPLSLRPNGYENYQTFHPTFLYEALWCFLSAAALIYFTPLLRRTLARRPGDLFISYIAIYCIGRLWIESLRIDLAHHLFGLRLNAWVSLFGIALPGLTLLVKSSKNRAVREVGSRHD